MNQRLRPEVFVCYLLAAVSCSDTPADRAGGTSGAPATNTTAGHGGAGAAAVSGSGGAGSAGQAGMSALRPGAECTPTNPPDSGAFAAECSGGRVFSWGSNCSPRYEQVSCYTAPAPNGEIACLPPSDPNVLSRVQEVIVSSGFSGEFVIESADELLLPASCEALVACCEDTTKPQTNERYSCYYGFNRVAHTELEAACKRSLEANQACKKPEQQPDSDAGNADADSLELCCYHVCGFGRGI